MGESLEKLGFEGFVVGMISIERIMGDIKGVVGMCDAGGGYFFCIMWDLCLN